MTATLFRPVGLHELALIWDQGMRTFPPRLAHQPIFYPVANLAYARQIARDWNAADEKSACSGFVTKFRIADAYLSNFEPHTVGSSEHVEYWIPAEALSSFNGAIQGLINVEEGFFGPAFTGYIPDAFLLKGKDAKPNSLLCPSVGSTAPLMSRARYRPIGRAYFSTGCSGRIMTFPKSVSVESNGKSYSGV
jgi:hypothetical protein